MRRSTPRYIESIDLDTLLYGNPSWDQVRDFFRYGDFSEEHYLVRAIKRHLRTPEQKREMDAADFSIEDMMNGRIEGDTSLCERIFSDWNTRLGYRHFGA